VSAPGNAVATRFDFERGPLSGTTFALHENVLVHRGSAMLETIPFTAIAAVRISYSRDATRIGWAIVLIVIALCVWAAASPLAALAASAGVEMTGQVRGDVAAGGQGMASALVATFRGLEFAARVLPVVAGAFLLAALILGGLGLWGATTLTLTLAAVEREYSVRGRDGMLYDFAEALSDRLLARGR